MAEPIETSFFVRAVDWLGRLLLVKAIVAAAVTAGVIVWAHLSKVPGVILFVLALATLLIVVALMTVLIALWDRHTGRGRTVPHVEPWEASTKKTDRGEQRRWGERQDATVHPRTAGARATVPTPGVTTERPPLAVSIEDEEWVPVQHSLLILRVKYRVRNQTDRPKQLQGVLFRAVEGVQLPFEDESLMREVRAVEARSYRVPGTVDAHDAVDGWKVLCFEHRPQGGTPEYEVGVEDEVRNVYWARMPAKPAEGWNPSTRDQ